MCRVGKFNLSHACITSQDTLSVLRNLHKTHPVLFEEFTSDESSGPTSDLAEEPEFTETPDDNSDIPVPELVNHLTSRSTNELVGISEEGELQSNSKIEDTMFMLTEDSAPKSSTSKIGRRAKKEPNHRHKAKV